MSAFTSRFVDAPTSQRACIALTLFCLSAPAHPAPLVLDPGLTVNTVVSGLNQPTGMTFLGVNDFLVLEKASGQVKRVTGGVVQGTVLDLAVNSASERGLLGIALSPNFSADSQVYLYWTESTTGADTNVLANTPLLGNRVDRFVWNGSTLTFDQNVIRLRSFQADAGQPLRGNHNGGIIRFGPDGKLYVEIGDVGRRGQLQNLPNGPFTPPAGDDQFGGPAPDNAHLTGAVLRLNPDGSTPVDNPFFAAGAAIGGEAGANIQKLLAYGIRNSFGMAFDPVSGQLWMTDNGDDAFDEINRVFPGMNGGWIQIMGPASRIAEYKAIEVASGNLQQIRWDPSNIANTQADALNALFVLPGAAYSDPEFSWKFGVAPSALGFLSGSGLGAQYAGNMFVGAARTDLDGGYLYRFVLDGARDGIDTGGIAGLADLVADNLAKFDGTESESLRFGTGFGTATDIQTGPNGNLFVSSLSNGAIYEIAALPVPEPGSVGLLALGLAGLLFARRRIC